MNILHLSDLHFTAPDKNGHFWNAEDVTSGRSAGCELLKTLLSDIRVQSIRPDLVVITGDLLDKYSREGIASATTFLGALRDGLNLKTRRVILVPGNHDVSRDPASSTADPYEHFRKLWDAYYNGTPALSKGGPHELAVVHDFVDELGVQIVGFNSCEGYVGDPGHRYHGHISQKQCEHIEKRLRPDAELNLALLHHHLARPMGAARADYSEVYESARLIQWLVANRFKLALHGHQHLDWHETRVVNNWALTIAAAGSVGVADYGRPHSIMLGYQVLAIESGNTGRRCRREYSVPRCRWEKASSLAAEEDGFLMGTVLATSSSSPTNHPKDVWPTIGLFRSLELANTHVEHFHYYSTYQCQDPKHLEEAYRKTHLEILRTSRLFSEDSPVDCNVLVARSRRGSSYKFVPHRHKLIELPMPKMELCRCPSTNHLRTLGNNCGVAPFMLYHALAGDMGAVVVEDVHRSDDVVFYKRMDRPTSAEAEPAAAPSGPVGAYALLRIPNVFRHAEGCARTDAGFRCLLSAPIMRVVRSNSPPPGDPGVRPYGVLNVTSNTPQHFTDVHAAWIEVLAGLLGALYSSYESAKERICPRDRNRSRERRTRRTMSSGMNISRKRRR